MASENKGEYNFQVQGVSIEDLARIIKEATNDDIRFRRFKVPKLTGCLTIPFTRKEYKTTSSVLGDVYFFDGGTWEDYREYKKIKKSKKKLVFHSAGDAGVIESFFNGSILGAAIVLIVLILGYFVGLALTWIIANIVTNGSYKQRKEITYLVIEFDMEKEEQVKRVVEKIFNKIIVKGGYVKPVTKKTFAVKSGLEEYNEQFIKAYTNYFNLGNMTLLASFSIIGLLTLVKLVAQFFLDAQQMVVVNYLFSIVYLLGLVALMGFILLTYGELKIRSVYNNVKRSEDLSRFER